MMNETDSRAAASDALRQVHIARVIRAPREAVFRAWSDKDRLARWFAPNGCTIRYRAFDFHEGGAYHSCIRTPDARECWCKGAYRKIAPHDLIEFTMRVSDAQGNDANPVAMGMDPAWPEETVVTVTFEDAPEGTLLTLRQTVDEALAMRTGAHPSWLQMLDNLEAQLQEERKC